MKKTLLYFAFIILVALYLGRISVFADTQTGECGFDATWTYDSDTQVLTISGTGSMDMYSEGDLTYDERGYEVRTTTAPFYSFDVKKLIIEDGITSIGMWDFAYMSIASVSISSTVTQIGDFAFREVTSLKQVTIPSSVQKIGRCAFSGCKLLELTIDRGVKTIGKSAFSSNNYLKTVSIPSSVEEIGEYAFDCCFRLTSITIPSSVTTIGEYAFEFDGLKTVIIQNGVKTIGTGAFYENEDLTSITIPSSVTSIGRSAFNGCYSLKTVSIKGSKTKINRYAFTGKGTVTNANMIIYGYKGSTAEKYAITYKIGFRTFGVKVPTGTSIKSLSKNKTRAKTRISLKKVSGAWKYEIQVSKAKSFGGEVAQVMTTKTKGTFKGFPTAYTNRKVYVRARVYKKIKGKIVVSNWSAIKTTKIKK